MQYFQWRKSRGSRKLHGAVVDHCGHENTRVFRDVAEVGSVLKKLDCIVGTTVRPDVAIIYDWENRWAIDDSQALRRDRKDYQQTCENHYRPFWKRGVPVDVINMDCDFTGYKLLIAPMLYMIRPGVAERIESFVKNGGVFVATYFSGYVDENDLCFLGGFPGPIRNVTGIWAEEIDLCMTATKRPCHQAGGGVLNLRIRRHILRADPCGNGRGPAEYKSDFYAYAALTKEAWLRNCLLYSRKNWNRFLRTLFRPQTGSVLKADCNLPEGVTGPRH